MKGQRVPLGSLTFTEHELIMLSLSRKCYHEENTEKKKSEKILQNKGKENN